MVVFKKCDRCGVVSEQSVNLPGGNYCDPCEKSIEEHIEEYLSNKTEKYELSFGDIKVEFFPGK